MRAAPNSFACASCASSKHSPIKNLISYYQREANQKEGARRFGFSRAYRSNWLSWHKVVNLVQTRTRLCGYRRVLPTCSRMVVPGDTGSNETDTRGRGL